MREWLFVCLFVGVVFVVRAQMVGCCCRFFGLFQFFVSSRLFVCLFFVMCAREWFVGCWNFLSSCDGLIFIFVRVCERTLLLFVVVGFFGARE